MPKQILNANGAADVINWYGGDGTMAVSGQFNSGSVKLQVSIDNGDSWFDAKDSGGNSLLLSENGAISFSVSPCKLRAVMAGASEAGGTQQTETLTLVGPSAVAATVAVLFLANPALGDTIMISNGTSRTYTFTSTSGTNNIVRGANLSATLTAIAAKLVADGYPTVASLGTTLTFTAATVGTVGNGYNVQLVGASPFFSVTGNYNYSGGKDAGVLTESGNITLEFDSSFFGSFVLSVPVLKGDIRATWVQKIANALQNENRIGKNYQVTNNGSIITMTFIGLDTSNDSTLRVRALNGSPSPGLPATYTSANGTFGVTTLPIVTVVIEER